MRNICRLKDCVALLLDVLPRDVASFVNIQKYSNPDEVLNDSHGNFDNTDEF